MESSEIRSRFLKFFETRGHKIIPSSSLVPENDPSVLFNIAGMQPLMKYLLGEKHPEGKRLVNIQKCIRTIDLDEVGDATHLTFFEMMGNWSLGDYFKEDAIKWSYEFLTNKEEGIGLDLNRLYITVFSGNDDIPCDTESVEIWKSVGIPESRIYFKNSKSNWWSAGLNSPAGPSTEMFYDLIGNLGDMNQEQFETAEDEQKVVEIWNDVFMVYKQEDGKVSGELPNKNVDTGAGLERITTVIQGKSNIYETDVFVSVMDLIKKNSINYNEKSARIIADHIRSAIFLISDGVKPSNKDQGYVLRRLIRRAVFKMKSLMLNSLVGVEIINYFINTYSDTYEQLKKVDINSVFNTEEEKFLKTLQDGMKEFEKGIDPFILFTTYGFPIELTIELSNERGSAINLEDFNKKMVEHQKLSQTSSVGMFKGGLADAGEETKRLHTATHLMRQALEDVLGEKIVQKGSNITAERLRFDFSFSRKMTDEEKNKVADIVNEKIQLKLPVQRIVMKKEEAEKTGAVHIFGDKYGEEVSIYYVGETLESSYSKEFCGGPHVKNTAELGEFKILKEEAVSAGVRRIKAVLF
ncbi:MAG: Alanine-tRNA ligase [Candidatus Nomurabacteria bacterium GW2011_GWE1_32_28]|uniref:alanine--tRNA ligase n=1 Tax=Candidatus Nomurabacteria bacterium GW2011_GWF1_31_48 TaxID=1618767 RepID=A0A0F9YGZ8_9BACT|nr:MAG: Alanine-tRNA ligase [Candidatus Nomurabacteria bacterium GW2011_GWF2_30_133]KKP28920.1 MAG: Alanine-tRNA ligase [Candidatus Nomurabacteria bacterium GW2011_GWE2_31_40]KKP30658.1 MAG: Alanine-tRNA ligase [Candidatus Nomurabacteria bacterium GW2011_GWF1_31_48]KKP35176.1 MAG: Alanine-tRNA ligase [Candidatus Nomurabacteria bacterium GW2011_GWE1_32_28]HAS80485.1 alanine--tRNA ligase [Candidatus Nomurabacteria bacterium]